MDLGKTDGLFIEWGKDHLFSIWEKITIDLYFIPFMKIISSYVNRTLIRKSKQKNAWKKTEEKSGLAKGFLRLQRCKEYKGKV